jgi:hypothetical protein
MLKRTCFATAVVVISAVAAMCAGTGVLSIVVRDSKTHSAVQAKVMVEGPKSLETETDKDGKLTLSLPTGEYQVSAAALGYRSMTWRGNVWARAANRPAEIFLFPAFAEAPVSGGTGVVSIWVRDAITHYAVPAKIELEGPKSLSLQTNGTGTITLPSGEYLEKISAPGYNTMWWDSRMIRPGNANPTPLGAMLQPVNPPEEEQSVASRLRPGYSLVRGYATDEEGHPVAGIRVRFKNAGAETTTNERGYYSFSILSPREIAEGYPGTDTLIAEKPGYKTIVHNNVLLEGGEPGGIALDMERGSGVIQFNDLPMSARPTDEHQDPEPEQPPKSSPASPKGARESSPQSSPMIGTSIVPPSIVVGLGCPRDPCQSDNPDGPCYHTHEDCVNNYPNGCPVCPRNRWHESSECTNPRPFALETYVRQGLESEWRAIWGNDGPDSLRAGAVAYRTYAAYFQQHPGRSGSSNYDIRSDECQQAFAVTVTPPNPRTSAAAQATAGIALSDDGTTAYKAEYSKNTNRTPPDPWGGWPGCMDGYTGDGADWPCMRDLAATGSTHSGHGRGMSQYGSYYWARGQSYQGQNFTAPGWQCILDHYYNDNGNSTGAGGQLTYRYSFIAGPGGDGQIVYAPVSAIPSRRGYTGLAPDSCYGASDLFTMQLDGSNFLDITPNQCNGQPAWDPRQKLIAYQMLPLGLAIINADGSGSTPLGFGAAPDWSQENVIVYQNLYGLYRVNPDGSGGLQINYDRDASNLFWSPWSPDGTKVTKVVYDTCTPPPYYCDTFQIAMMNADGTGQPIFLTSGSSNVEPAWSPDGKYIAFISDRGGSAEIYLMNSDGSGSPTQLTFSSPYPIAYPRWSQDGHYIVWLSLLDNASMLNIMDFPSGQNQYSYGPALAPGEQKMNTTRCRRFDAL